MKVALLVGANPKTCQVGPTVRLEHGKWLVHVERDFGDITQNRTDLQLNVNGQPHNEATIEVNGVTAIVVFTIGSNRGNERFISAYAERVN